MHLNFINGKIIDILKEKKIFENINRMKEDIQKVDLEKEKKEIEPVIKENDIIRKNQKYIYLEEKNKIRGELKNPFEIWEKIENIDLKYIGNDAIFDIYLTYIINIYFCAEDEYEFLCTLSKNYTDIKMMITLKRNIEKRELLKKFDF